jgi:type IV pilus assembly protein PilC
LLQQHIEIGRPLSKILQGQKQVPMSFQTLIALGEQTGTLPQQMKVAVDEMMRARLFRQRLLGSLLYPAILLIVTILIVVFLLVVIFPKITPIFATFGAELPLSTRILIRVSHGLTAYGLWFMIGVTALVVLSIWAKTSLPLVTQTIAASLLRLPIVGYVVRHNHVSQICRMISLLIGSGVRSSEAVAIVASHTKHPLYQRALIEIQSELEQGRKLSKGFSEHPTLFSLDAIALLSVAEDSGSLPQTLRLIAEMYEQDLDEYIKKLTILVEPLLMVSMGLIIGFIAVSIITPLYGLTSVLSQ